MLILLRVNLPPKPKKAQIEAAPNEQERERLKALLVRYEKVTDATTKRGFAENRVKSATKDIAKNQNLKAKAQAQQGKPRPDSELQALEKTIADKRKQLLAFRKQIEDIHNDPQSAQIVARLKKANEAFR